MSIQRASVSTLCCIVAPLFRSANGFPNAGTQLSHAGSEVCCKTITVSSSLTGKPALGSCTADSKARPSSMGTGGEPFR